MAYSAYRSYQRGPRWTRDQVADYFATHCLSCHNKKAESELITFDSRILGTVKMCRECCNRVGLQDPAMIVQQQPAVQQYLL